MLILDEPANGLDPEGVHWLRGFLRAFADDGGTVLVSSHLLAEIAQTVDDVVIIARGRLVAQSSLADLTRRSRTGRARPDARSREELRSTLAGARHRRRAGRLPTRCVALETTPEAVGLAAAGAGVVLYEMTAEHVDLEEMFLELTATAEAVLMTTPRPRRAAEAAHHPHVLGQRRGRAGARAARRRAGDQRRPRTRSTAPTASAT